MTNAIADKLDLVMRLREFTNEELAKRVESSTQKIQQRRSGRTKVKAGELGKIAGALEVPVDLFIADRATVLAWFANHPEYAARDSNPEPTDYGQLSLTEPEPGEVHFLAPTG